MREYLKLMRVKHYLKNLLIFAVIIFNKSFFNGNYICANILNFISFSLISSIVYIINDICDIEKDRRHPLKKLRPLAKGTIKIKNAFIFAIILFFIASIINYIPILFIKNYPLIYTYACIYGYLILNICYSKGLKSFPIVDIFILSFGFIIRVIYGSVSIGIEISNWMYLTVLVVSLYISLGKRRNEYVKNGIKSRDVLKYYSEEYLNKFMNIFLGSSIIFYSLWANSMNSIFFLLSVLIVIFILMRYSLIIDNKLYDDPVDVVISDKVLVILSIIFFSYMGVILYVF